MHQKNQYWEIKKLEVKNFDKKSYSSLKLEVLLISTKKLGAGKS